jgi:hypothetical protein
VRRTRRALAYMLLLLAFALTPVAAAAVVPPAEGGARESSAVEAGREAAGSAAIQGATGEASVIPNVPVGPEHSSPRAGQTLVRAAQPAQASPLPASVAGSAPGRAPAGPPPCQKASSAAAVAGSLQASSAGLSGLLTPASPEVILTDPGSIFIEAVGLEVSTSVPEASISSVQFQLSPPGAARWETIAVATFCRELTPGVLTYQVGFESKERPNGLYDLRAVVIDEAKQEHASATLSDRLVANNAPVVTLEDPGAIISGRTITLTAHVPQGEEIAIAAVQFQWAIAGSEAWHTAAAVHQPPEQTTANFATLPDGSYDFRALPETKSGQQFASIPARGRLVDNTPPQVALSDPGSPLHGRVFLSASACDAGSGVAAVVFERARAGSNAWQKIGEATLPPTSASPTSCNSYSVPFNSEALKNGLYDLRATASDRAHNTQTSPVMANVEVKNQVLPPVVSASIVSEEAPASGVTILGDAKGPSTESETWAFGFSSAPPAQALDGSTLPYTGDGDQLVLLRHTDSAGWQIADVLRCPPELSRSGDPRCDPSGAFRLLPADKVSTTQPPLVVGAMTPSGEAWLWLKETSNEAKPTSVIGLFHRLPGGSFELDPGATRTLHPLLERADVRLRLGPANGQGPAYGILTGGTTTYGLLANGAWSEQPAPSGAAAGGEAMNLMLADVEGPSTAWGAFEGAARGGALVLGHLENGQWSLVPTGLDALDLTRELANGKYEVKPEALKAEEAPKAAEGGVWIEANVYLAGRKKGRVVARYDAAKGEVTNSWCTLRGVPNSCEEPLDLAHPAAVPDAIFQTTSGKVALSLGDQAVHVFSGGTWSSIPAPGHGPATANLRGGGDAFADPNEGWLGGATAVGHWSSGQSSSVLASWPLPDRSPMMSVALPPASQGAVGESGALAVGLDGTTLRYDSSTGWLVQAVPARARQINLLGVAFAGASSAFAVGQFGVILRWNGTAWSEDPQSSSLTESQLDAVAFAPSGEGWAVGANGTILHYDGRSWSSESPPPADQSTNITSVAVAGSDVYAIAGGNLIERGPGGWQEVPSSLLPSGPAARLGALRVVAGLPDGGAVAAGRSVVIVREAPGEKFQNAAQPLEGSAVALAPFRQANGKLRAYVSVAPPVAGRADLDFPPGDGELLRQSDTGWQDLSRAQYAGAAIRGDGAVKSDPVLAVASGPTGEHAWAVGGYAGSVDAAQQGTTEVLAQRPVGWKSASIWRYDAGGCPPSTSSCTSSALTQATPSLPAKAGTVSFAFFTSPTCRLLCTGVPDAQPDVNLTAAAAQIATYAAQPGGPAFAMLGGEARGPIEPEAGTETALDFARLPSLLAPLGGVPTFAALGRRDSVPGLADETQPWAEAFAEAPPPFGSGSAAASITQAFPEGAATRDGLVRRYYAFDAHQNGATVRVIVLDNSNGSLEKSSAGQTAWLETQLANAQGEHLPVVAITALPLRGPAGGGDALDGQEIASLLASKGALAVFTTNPKELDQHYLVPSNPGEGPQIPEYEGGSLGYQQEKNHGVLWYLVSLDAATSQVHVNAIPVLDSLSLKPRDGLAVARSRTLRFEAIGRRPAGTLASRSTESSPYAGYDNYVEIPAPGCGECVSPSYSFNSADPTIGDFVVPNVPNSPVPKLDASGHPIHSSTSGLFCAYNSGSTMVSITAGLLSYSLPVTVQAGGFGPPCGTVYRAGVNPEVRVSSNQLQSRLKGAAAPPPPPPAVASSASPAPAPVPPPPAPQHPAAAPAPPPAPAPAPPAKPAAPAPQHAPPPPAPEAALPPPLETVAATPAILPAATPPVEPIPPGASGYAQSPAAAKRREEARKHASQSAFALRPADAVPPAGAGGDSWFYVAVGVTTLLALLISARSLARPRPRPALLQARSDAAEPHTRRV